MSTIAIRLKWEIHRALDRVLKADVESLRSYEANDGKTRIADEELSIARAIVGRLRRAYASEVVYESGLRRLQEIIETESEIGNSVLVERLKEIQTRVVSNCRLPQTGETRRGSNEAMNDAFVKAYNPNVDPPFYVEWPKGNELGSGGWYCEESILAFWPEVVPDEPVTKGDR